MNLDLDDKIINQTSTTLNISQDTNINN